MPPGERQKLFGCYKQLKRDFLTFLASWLSPNVIQIDFTNTTVSYEELFDLSVVLMQNVFKI